MLFPATARIYTGIFQRASFTGNERALTLKALLKELMLQSLAFTFTPRHTEHGHVRRKWWVRSWARQGWRQGRRRVLAGRGLFLVFSDLKVWPKGPAPLLGSPVRAGNGFLSWWGQELGAASGALAKP